MAESAPPAPGQYPAVVLSHGLFGMPVSHHRLAQELAQAGFIVIAPVHDDGPAVAQRYTRRTREISIALDRVLMDPLLNTHLDIYRIGGFGFSLGGASILAAAGGRIDFDLVRSHCRNALADPEFCDRGGIGTVPGVVPLVPDPRLKSVVLAAPIGVMFSELDAITADVWVIRAGQDKQLRFPFHAEHIRGLMTGPYRYSFEPEAHHYAFLSPFPAVLVDEIGAPARDPAGFDRRAFQRRINADIVAHFSETLIP
ncbi:alpha/beta hydrolase family protein [Alphaproteobacteria bacterium LSUCC0684]